MNICSGERGKLLAEQSSSNQVQQAHKQTCVVCDRGSLCIMCVAMWLQWFEGGEKPAAQHVCSHNYVFIWALMMCRLPFDCLRCHAPILLSGHARRVY